MAFNFFKNMTSQQKALSYSDYDLRVTNLARFLYKRIDKKPGRLIDIGAGNGLILRFFKNKGFDVTGMEMEKELCIAMEKHPLMKGIKIINNDITKVKGNEDYDYVVASDVIEHIKDDHKALEDLLSFVKPGGHLIITVPAHQFLYGKRDKIMGHFRRYAKKELLDKLNKFDIKVKSINYWNFYGYFAYYLFEKLLNKPVNEKFRYKKSTIGSFIAFFLDLFLRGEELMGGAPIGLTLVAVVKKNT